MLLFYSEPIQQNIRCLRTFLRLQSFPPKFSHLNLLSVEIDLVLHFYSLFLKRRSGFLKKRVEVGFAIGLFTKDAVQKFKKKAIPIQNSRQNHKKDCFYSGEFFFHYFVSQPIQYDSKNFIE
jgi:hypothetical protein